MNRTEYQEHWDHVFLTKDTTKVSWYQQLPEQSLQLIERFSNQHSAVIDVGGGDSRLPDELLKRGYRDITVVDISQHALNKTQSRLDKLSNDVSWIVSNILDLSVEKQFELWHDRAVFHFINGSEDQLLYKTRLLNHLPLNACAIIGGFSAKDGPLKCSGLDVTRHSKSTVSSIFQPEFELVETFEAIHETPSGVQQNFIWSVLKRII